MDAPEDRSLRRGFARSGAVLLGVLVPLVLALPASGSETPARIAGSATIVIHGQGRVTSEPPGAIDCPGRCTLAFTGSTQLTLRAAAATGWEIEQLAFCVNVDVCTVALNDFTYNLDVYFRPRAELQLWPRGDGAITVSPQPADDRGLPTAPTCNRENAFEGTGCRFYYLPGTRVTATASADPGSTFLGWSSRDCPGTGSCTVTMSRDDVSLVARYTPLEVRVIKEGPSDRNGRQRAAGDRLPADVHGAVPGRDAGHARRAARSGDAVRQLEVRLRRRPDGSEPVRARGDEPAQLGRRRARRGRRDRRADEPLRPLRRRPRGAGRRRRAPARLRRHLRAQVRVRRRGGAARPPGRRLALTTWRGACAKQPTCRLYVGPVTSVAAQFTENLVPKLLSVAAAGKKKGRKVTVRLSVTHTAQARLQLRRVGKTKLLAERRSPLKGGANAVVLPVPAGVAAGKLRLTIAVSDGLGGGRTWNRVVTVGA